MKKIISLFFLSVYCAFVAGTLLSASEDNGFNYHSSEFKGKYVSSKIQKHLPFSGKVKLTRPHLSPEIFNNPVSLRHTAFHSSFSSTEKPFYSSLSLYIRNRILLI